VVQVAGPKFLNPLLGQYPSLSDLDEGDLKHSIDYRRVYASLLRDWLAVDPREILGDRFEPLPLFQARS
jgi:uncharacterized protein (DUF1501 family)